MSDRTVHATTALFDLARYNRAGKWYLETKVPGMKTQARRPVKLAEAVRWVLEQPSAEVTVYWGKPGGNQFEAQIWRVANPGRWS